jgi:hypothetical protein
MRGREIDGQEFRWSIFEKILDDPFVFMGAVRAGRIEKDSPIGQQIECPCDKSTLDLGEKTFTPFPSRSAGR